MVNSLFDGGNWRPHFPRKSDVVTYRFPPDTVMIAGVSLVPGVADELALGKGNVAGGWPRLIIAHEI